MPDRGTGAHGAVPTLLRVDGLAVSYGRHRALKGVSLQVAAGEIVVILGANGAGKTTLLKAIAGIEPSAPGSRARLGSTTLTGLAPDRVVEAGLALVPEGRGVFPELSVRENLLLGAYSRRARAAQQRNLEQVHALFPRLAERARQTVRTMSGGEQQMVAIGRALMSAPTILMLDEPSLGLSPLLCSELFRNLQAVRATGTGILLVEQNARQSLAIADRAYLLENGEIVGEGRASDLARDPAVQAAYLGVAKEEHTRDEPAEPEGCAAPSGDAPAPFPVGKPSTITTSADALVPISIADLVHTASQQSSRHGGAHALEHAGTAPTGYDSLPSLDAVLAEVESAARRAREQRPSPAGPPVQLRVEQEAPRTIEIWRRPRLEIHRRQPDGTMKKDESR